jgi:phosphoribosylformimino-5-aminoimidazole carboxamide ribotide isomerase
MKDESGRLNRAHNQPPPMEIIPAIDLRGGRCVRLRQGDFDQETVFGHDPAESAACWEAEGASRIHVVDLDGARSGWPVNVESVRRIVQTVKIPCQLGGGLRDEATIAVWLEAGVDRLVVGTMALREPEWFSHMARAYPGRLLLGLDAREGRVAAQGWLELSTAPALDLARKFDRLPLAGIIYTDIARDGTLEGPNLEGIAALLSTVETPVIASGGIGDLGDLERLGALPLAGCIVGRALYEGRFTLGEAIRRVEQSRRTA